MGPLISGKSRLVKYYNLARIYHLGFFCPSFCYFLPQGIYYDINHLGNLFLLGIFFEADSANRIFRKVEVTPPKSPQICFMLIGNCRDCTVPIFRHLKTHW